MMRLLAGLAVASAAVIASASCSTLEPLDGNACGNLVVEAGEDCDGPSALGSCPADSGCRFVCGGANEPCPAGMVCSLTDHVCRGVSPNPAKYSGAHVDALTFGASARFTIATQATGLTYGDFNADGVGDLFVVGDNGQELYVGSSTGLRSSFATKITLAGRVGGFPPHVDALPLEDAPYDGDPRGDFDAAGATAQHQDATADLLFTTEIGAGVLTGREDGALTPIAYPAIEFGDQFAIAGYALLAPALGQSISAHPYVFIQPTSSNSQTMCPDGSTHALALQAPGLPAAFCWDNWKLSSLSRFEAPVVDPHLRSGCPTIVFGFKGDASISGYQPCDDSGATTVPSSWAAHRTVVNLAGPLEAPLELAWGPFTFDEDHDGLLDAFVGTTDGHVRVAHGLPGGRFDDFEDYPVQLLKPTIDGTGEAVTTVGTPLAVADLNGDGVVDLVSTGGIFLSTPCVLDSSGEGGAGPTGGAGGAGGGGGGACARRTLVRAFDAQKALAGAEQTVEIHAAVVADVDRDGHPDVVFSTMTQEGAGGPHLDGAIRIVSFVDQGEVVPRLDIHVVSVPRGVDALEAGDFNGDGYGDVAFVETGARMGRTAFASGCTEDDPHCTDPDSVSVIFGAPGADYEPVSVGDLEGVLQLAGLHSRAFDGFLNGFTDLGVVSRGSEDYAKSRVAELLGEEGHTLLAALSPIDEDVNGPPIAGTPIAAAAGLQRQSDGQRLMALLTVPAVAEDGAAPSNSFLLWYALLDADRATLSQKEAFTIPTAIPGIAYDASTVTNAVMTVGDVDGDGVDELVIAITVGDTTHVYVAPASDLGEGLPLTQQGEPSPAPFSEVASLPGTVVRLAVAQLDDPAQFAPSVVMLVDDGNDGGDARGTLHKLDLSAGGAVGPSRFDAALRGVKDFALQRRFDAGNDLFFVVGGDAQIATGVYRFDRDVDAANPQLLTGIPTTDLLGPIAVGDIDGDRLADVAVATQQGVQIFRGALADQ